MAFVFTPCRRVLLLLMVIDLGTFSAGGAEKPDASRAKTDEIIAGSLKWLARQQKPNGSWALSLDTKEGTRYASGATAHVMLAFIAAGNTHEKGEYATTVAAGLNYLTQAQTVTGYMGEGGTMYAHGSATVVVAELYSQTKDETLKPIVAAAVKLIITSQSKEGGWRYAPRPLDADLSVTGFEIAALIAARRGGIDVPQATLDKAVAYVNTCSDPTGGFTYKPKNNLPSVARTAIALHSLFLCGRRDEPEIKAGLRYLADHPKPEQWHAYGRYFAAAAHAMQGGDEATQSAAELASILRTEVLHEGADLCFWDDQFRYTAQGPIYLTAINTAILCLPRGHLALYRPENDR